MPTLRRALPLLLPFVAACRVGSVPTEPLVGAAPATIAVWPLVDAREPSTDPVWFAGLAASLARRGYRVVPPAVARQMLADAGLSLAVEDETAVGRVLQADALLRLRVRQFESDGDRALQRARWDVEWQLVSTRGLGVQWSFVHRGNWRQADRDPLAPRRDLDDPDLPPDIVPIGGTGVPGFRDLADLMAWLHRLAMERLPELEPR